MVTIGGRTIQHTTTVPVPGGFLVKCDSAEAVYKGDVLDVDGKTCRVMYLLRFPAGEPELWLTVEVVTVKAERTTQRIQVRRNENWVASSS